MIKFQLTKKEEKRAHKFLEKYPPDYAGAAGGNYWYTILPTGLGNIIKISVKSGNKKYEKDITDFDSW